MATPSQVPLRTWKPRCGALVDDLLSLMRVGRAAVAFRLERLLPNAGVRLAAMSTSQAITLFGILVALLIGLGGIGASIAQTASSGRRETRNRIFDRRADAYLKLIRLIEARGRSVQDHIWNARKSDEHNMGYGQRIEVDEPRRVEHAEAASLVAAFGSDSVRTSFETWSSTLDAVDDEFDSLGFQWSENPETPLDTDRLGDVLGPAEIAARTDVGRLVREEMTQK